MNIAIVHDHIAQAGGAERLLLTLAEALDYPPIYTSVFEPARTYPEFESLDVRPSKMLQHRQFRQNHRLTLPLLPAVFNSMNFDCDVLLCSSAGWSHNARCTGRKVIYWHSPNRWLYTPTEALGGRHRVVGAGIALGAGGLRCTDRRSAVTAVSHLANSNEVQRRVALRYGRLATVVPPPVSISPDLEQEAVPGMGDRFHLVVSRLVPYKNVDKVVEAFRSRPDDRLVVVGSGPERAKLVETAPPNCTFLGRVPDGQVRWLYANATALIAPAYEDFGLTPLEAASFGTPTLALSWGGYLDTVVPGVNGAFFPEPSARCINEAIDYGTRAEWDIERIRRHARSFSKDSFRRAIVSSLAAVV